MSYDLEKMKKAQIRQRRNRKAGKVILILLFTVMLLLGCLKGLMALGVVEGTPSTWLALVKEKIQSGRDSAVGTETELAAGTENFDGTETTAGTEESAEEVTEADGTAAESDGTGFNAGEQGADSSTDATAYVSWTPEETSSTVQIYAVSNEECGVDESRGTGYGSSIGGLDLISKYAILIDEDTGEVVAEKYGTSQIYPASMTKILTLLTAAEALGLYEGESNEEEAALLKQKIVVSSDATSYSYANGCSAVGFEIGEKVTLMDLFCGTVLKSGGDAAYQLAVVAGGDYDTFVNLMNDKVAELGLSSTSHFTNPVGIYDDNLYSRPCDIAVILQAAMQNPFCREVLSLHTYTTRKTKKHPDGITISNLFLRRIEDHITGGTVVAAKTGFVNQSGNCAASFFTADDGKDYICVTAGSTSAWRCIYDHCAMYQYFAE